MAWFTTKKGKHVNTDWFLKDEQIRKNQEIADKLNATGHAATPVGGKRIRHEDWKPLKTDVNKWGIDTGEKKLAGNIFGDGKPQKALQASVYDWEFSVQEPDIRPVTKSDMLKEIDGWKNDDGTYGFEDESFAVAYEDGHVIFLQDLEPGEKWSKKGISGISISTGDYEMVWGGEWVRRPYEKPRFEPYETHEFDENGNDIPGHQNSYSGVKNVGYRKERKVKQERAVVQVNKTGRDKYNFANNETRVKTEKESEVVQRSTPEWTETKQKEIGKNLKNIREQYGDIKDKSNHVYSTGNYYVKKVKHSPLVQNRTGGIHSGKQRIAYAVFDSQGNRVKEDAEGFSTRNYETQKQAKAVADKLEAKNFPKTVTQNESKIKSPDEIAQRFSNTLSKKGISNEWEIQNYIRNLTSARRNTMCRELGITGSVDEKIKNLSHQIYLAGKTNESGVPTNNLIKFNDKQEVFKQAKDGWTFAKTSSGDLWVGFENDLDKQYYKDTPENRKMLSSLWENQNFSKEIKSTSKTIENKYGFEITNKEDRPVSFTESHWKKMAELRKKGEFQSGDIKNEVKRKADEVYMSNEYRDMWGAIAEKYGEDVASLFEHIEYDYITDDEYWAGWHLLAEWMGLKKDK